jgi:hypothetical protein
VYRGDQPYWNKTKANHEEGEGGGNQRDDERLDNGPGKNANEPGLELIERQAEV